MEVKGSHAYAAPIDAVLAMLRDRDATVAKFEGMGARDVVVLECEQHDGDLHVLTSRVVDVDLPGFAKKVLKPTNTLRQDDQWHKADSGEWDGTFNIEMHGSPVHLAGTMRLVPTDDGCRHEVVVNVDVHVPLVGGRIAEWAAKNDVQRSLDAEFDFGDRWLTTHKV
jgi:hypothetical protein